MAEDLHRLFTDYSIKKLRQMEERIESCLAKLSAEQIWARGCENENAVGNLVLHLSGNVRQWIVSGVGGRADSRDRDAEFAARGGAGVEELIARLRAAVEEATSVIDGLSEVRLTEWIKVQKYDVSVMEAVYHVVEHFSGHTGQIIFATKMMTGTDLQFYGHLKTTAAHGQNTP